MEEATIDHIKTHLPRSNYTEDHAWLSAVTAETEKKTFEIARSIANSPKLEEYFSDEILIFRDLAIEERIDAMIDKDIKRLGHIKAMKNVLFWKASPRLPTTN